MESFEDKARRLYKSKRWAEAAEIYTKVSAADAFANDLTLSAHQTCQIKSKSSAPGQEGHVL
jgi:hypothetical protein